MEISDLTQSVRDLWNFAWPTIINLILIISILIYICPRVKTLLKLKIKDRHRRFLIRLKDSEALKLLGIPQMIPFLTLFAIIFLLFITQNIASVIGSFLPGRLSYNPTALLIHSVPPEELKQLWMKYPQIQSVEDLEKILEVKYQEVFAQDENALGYGHWTQKLGRMAQLQSYLKFYALWAFASLLYALYLKCYKFKALRRTIYVLLAILVVFAFSVNYMVYCYSQEAIGKVYAVSTYSSLSSDLEEPSVKQLKQIESNISSLDRNAQETWWSLEF